MDIFCYDAYQLSPLFWKVNILMKGYLTLLCECKAFSNMVTISSLDSSTSFI
jgi:hypothetical protein